MDSYIRVVCPVISEGDSRLKAILEATEGVLGASFTHYGGEHDGQLLQTSADAYVLKAIKKTTSNRPAAISDGTKENLSLALQCQHFLGRSGNPLCSIVEIRTRKPLTRRDLLLPLFEALIEKADAYLATARSMAVRSRLPAGRRAAPAVAVFSASGKVSWENLYDLSYLNSYTASRHNFPSKSDSNIPQVFKGYKQGWLIDLQEFDADVSDQSLADHHNWLLQRFTEPWSDKGWAA